MSFRMPRLRVLGGLVLLAMLASCQPSSAPGPAESSGQVAAPVAQQVSYYAAARFADQASFGPTPQLIAEIRAKGFSKWIDDQWAQPVSQVNLTPLLGFTDPIPQADWAVFNRGFSTLALSAPDQLRVRVAWSMSQWVVVSMRKVDIVGVTEWQNLLLRNAGGNYRSFLYEMSISPAMGVYLDNSQNRPKSAECPHCAPNENFAREIMQLFSLGVFKLNPDGTPVRGANGAYLETYSQHDVEELARVFTGWTWDPVPSPRSNRNFANWTKPMVPSTWPPERDSGAKSVLGRNFPAGQTPQQDLSDAVDMLMAHGNTAPFVALRLIQHLVKSNPTPGYVGRVAAVFANNGQGVAGDMKATVKAVLLDAEARAGDNPAFLGTDDGKFREPFLHMVGLLRGMRCAAIPSNDWGPLMPATQSPFSAESVFSWYAPTDRAPGSNLLAPEQRLMNSAEFSVRMNMFSGIRTWDPVKQKLDDSPIRAAGCDIDGLIAAFNQGARAFGDYLSERYFRGAMPPSVRVMIDDLIRNRSWNASDPTDGPVRVLDFILSSPYYGIIQ